MPNIVYAKHKSELGERIVAGLVIVAGLSGCSGPSKSTAVPPPHEPPTSTTIVRNSDTTTSARTCRASIAPERTSTLDANPRIHIHHTPPSASWLNLVEVWFSIERQARFA